MNFTRASSLVFLLALTACSHLPQVKVRNKSGEPIENVVLTGPGFTNRIGAMKPAQHHKVRVQPFASGDIVLHFEANQGQLSAGATTVIDPEPHYLVIFTVLPGPHAIAVAGIKRCIPKEEL